MTTLRPRPASLVPGLFRVGALVVAVAAGAGSALVALAASPGQAVVERELMMMGTRLRLGVAASDHDAALAASEAAVEALAASERRLSTWREDSELSRLNATPPGSDLVLSPELAGELAAALDCSARTAGAFDPAVGHLIDLWDLRGTGRIPAPAEIAAALPASRAGAFALRGRLATRRAAALRLEEGGFGKGAGLDDALAALGRRPPVRAAWLDLGGQTALLGEGPWVVTVAHPDHRDEAAVRVTLDGGSLATSGTAARAGWAARCTWWAAACARRARRWTAPGAGCRATWRSATR